MSPIFLMANWNRTQINYFR